MQSVHIQQSLIKIWSIKFCETVFMQCIVYIHTNKAEISLTVHHLGHNISQYFERCVCLCLEVGNRGRIPNYWTHQKELVPNSGSVYLLVHTHPTICQSHLITSNLHSILTGMLVATSMKVKKSLHTSH
jgi:hypothetical protein